MQQNNIQIKNTNDEHNLENDGNSILFVSMNNDLVALIGVKDILKEDASIAIRKLKEKNIDVVMLTGDNEKTAEMLLLILLLKN